MMAHLQNCPSEPGECAVKKGCWPLALGLGLFWNFQQYRVNNFPERLSD